MCYTYDAWGNHTVSGSNVALGDRNPFRYRSYFYDPETRLYFLKTRYYDPEIGRFISPDSIDYADPMSLDGLNLYAYCNNNPVMNVDPTGQSFLVFVLVGLIAGAVIGGTVKGIEAHNDGATGWDLAGEIALGASIGAIIGAVAGAVVGAGAAVIGAGMTAIGGGAAAIAGGGTIASGGALIATGIGAVVAGSALVATGIVGGLLGLNVRYSRNPDNNFPVTGTPNSEVGIGDSVGAYDNMGHLMFRKDFNYHGGYNPHTHLYHWFYKNGKWVVNIARKILPF